MSNKTTEVIRQKTTGCNMCEVMKTGGMYRRGILAIYLYIYIYIIYVYIHTQHTDTLCVSTIDYLSVLMSNRMQYFKSCIVICYEVSLYLLHCKIKAVETLRMKPVAVIHFII